MNTNDKMREALERALEVGAHLMSAKDYAAAQEALAADDAARGTMREAFEAMARKKGFADWQLVRDDDDYRNDSVSIAWWWFQWSGDYWQAASRAAAPQSAEPVASLSSGDNLWLWRNGDHFLAFRHSYPCYSPGGDPMTLGEPFGRAIFRDSYNREGKPNEQQRSDRQGEGRCSNADIQRRHAASAGQAHAAGDGASLGHGERQTAPQSGWSAGNNRAGQEQIPDIARAGGVLAARRDIAQGVATSPTEADRLNAERYLWLREGCNSKTSEATHIAANCWGLEWDAAIDAAMSAQAGGKEKVKRLVSGEKS